MQKQTITVKHIKSRKSRKAPLKQEKIKTGETFSLLNHLNFLLDRNNFYNLLWKIDPLAGFLHFPRR